MSRLTPSLYLYFSVGQRARLRQCLFAATPMSHEIFEPGLCSRARRDHRIFRSKFLPDYLSKGTKIITDPLAPGMHATPVVTPHVVTVGREHPNHSYVELARGTR